MTPDQFLLEYWREHRTYMGSKEHLIEVTATVYLVFVSALLLREDSFWLERHRLVFALTLWLLTTLIAWGFVAQQFRYWSDAARVSNASQTVMARWLAKTPEDAELVPVTEPSLPAVDVPKALADEIRRRREGWDSLSRSRRLCDSPFEIMVYGLWIIWDIALLTRVWMSH